MSEVLDILLAGLGRSVQKDPETRKYKMLRLSKDLGTNVEFKVRSLSYDQAARIRELPDTQIQSVLAGVVEPDFRDKRLAVRYGVLQEGQDWGAGGMNPPDLVRAILLPGEIAELSLRIEELSGYRQMTMKEVKKN